MKILFIGCVESSARLLSKIDQIPEVTISGIVSRSNSPSNADFSSLLPFAEHHNIPALDFHPSRKNELFLFASQLDLDAIFCFGWSHIISQDILDLAPRGAIGFHPAPLPKGRGRHPIIWALALGLTETASSFFLMTNEADAGDIVSQVPVTICASDNAGSLYKKIVETACEQVQDWVPQFADNTLDLVPQSPNNVSVWRKRDASDGKIDWRMPAQGVHNLVRALHRPYPGATTNFEGTNVIIWKTEIVTEMYPFVEPGKVLECQENRVLVKCGNGCVRVLEHEFPTLPNKGSYL